jgi:ABC-type transport system substrate-binding protein
VSKKMSRFSAAMLMTLFGMTKITHAETLRSVATVSDNWNFDPIDIDDIEKHELSDGLHATLVEWDYNRNEIVAGLSSAFYWEGTNLFFKVRPGSKTSKGDLIKASDVVFSLQRAFLSGKNLIGNLHELLCSKPNSGKPKCDRIIAIDDNVIKLELPYRSPAFIDFLTAANYGVVLEKNVDEKTNQIIDVSNTTGPYAVTVNNSSQFVLKANKNHWQISTENPTEIVFLRSPKNVDATDWSIEKIKKGDIDYIGITPGFGYNDYKSLRDHFGEKASFHVSDEISVTKLNFTVRGMEIPVEIRQALSKVIQSTVDKKRHTLPSYKRATVEFTIPGSYGSFTKNNEDDLAKLRLSVNDNFSFGRKIILGVPDSSSKALMEKYLGPILEKIEIVVRDYSELTLACQKLTKDSPDMIADSWDLGYVENFSAIALYVQRGTFWVRGRAADEWINKYMATEDSNKRLKMYRDLHVQSIATNPSVIPLWTTPYRAIAINNWSLDSSSPNESVVHILNIKRKSKQR